MASCWRSSSASAACARRSRRATAPTEASASKRACPFSPAGGGGLSPASPAPRPAAGSTQSSGTLPSEEGAGPGLRLGSGAGLSGRLAFKEGRFKDQVRESQEEPLPSSLTPRVEESARHIGLGAPAASLEIWGRRKVCFRLEVRSSLSSQLSVVDSAS